MKQAYFICGLGAKCALFDKIILPDNYNRNYLEFIHPSIDDDLESYALRLGQNIEPNSIVIGLSLGGMMATEIVKNRPDLTGILISSIPVKTEFPKYLNAALNLRLNRMINKSLVMGFLKYTNSILTKNPLNAEDEKSFMDMVSEGDFDFYLWCIEAIKIWNNRYYPSNIIRIHGTSDNVLPIKYKSKIDCIIDGGSHFMLLNKHSEINQFLRMVL